MYIRTKDGIFRAVDLHNDGHYVGLWNPEVKILAKSETIEELCDEFVLYDNQLKTCGVFDKKVITFKWIQNHSTIYNGMTIYGAIWTDKGLIYVAKMNEDGELELIWQIY